MTIDINKYVTYGVITLIIASVGFAGGVLWTVEHAYDTGYKMAYLEMKQILKEGYHGNQDFYISGLPYKFRPQADRKALQIVGVGGVGRSVE